MINAICYDIPILKPLPISSQLVKSTDPVHILDYIHEIEKENDPTVTLNCINHFKNIQLEVINDIRMLQILSG